MPKYPICVLWIFPGTLLWELPVFAEELSPAAAEASHSPPITAVNNPLKLNASLALAIFHPQNLLKASSNVLQIKSIHSKSPFRWPQYHIWNSLAFIYPDFCVLSVKQATAQRTAAVADCLAPALTFYLSTTTGGHFFPKTMESMKKKPHKTCSITSSKGSQRGLNRVDIQEETKEVLLIPTLEIKTWSKGRLNEPSLFTQEVCI